MSQANSNTLDFNQQMAMGARLKEEQKKDKAIENNDEEPKNWSAVAGAKRVMGAKKAIADKAKDKVLKPAQMAAKRGLQWGWATLIPSWGFSLLWINIHVFLRTVFPNIFCKLGEEWLPKEVLEKTGSAGKEASAAAFIVESMLLVALYFLFFLIIGSVLAIIVWLCKHFILKNLLLSETGRWVIKIVN